MRFPKPKFVRAVIKSSIAKFGYDSQERALELNQLVSQFATLGLDYAAAKACAAQTVLDGNFGRSDNSQHYELFAGISQVCNPQRILEIGTFRGESTAFLATLFPHAYIETWDLPEVSEGGMKSYVDENQRHYKDQRATCLNNIGDRANVHQIKQDSMGLLKETLAFDLIWVDGDHTFPVVAFDLINALRISGPTSWILVDDIKLSEMRGSVLASTEANRCIEHLVRSGHVTSHLIYKRVGASGRRWRDNQRRKHIAVLKKV